jgi:small GTP-binding protein
MGHIRKIVILGTTGSGKTTFLKNLVEMMGEKFSGAEVKRQVQIEEAQILNTFTSLDDSLFEDSTTTVSMNARDVLFLTTINNQFHFFPLKTTNFPFEKEYLDYLYPTLLVDTAGQERFSFMQEIGLKGSDGVIIFADGTNIQSIERIAHFCNLISAEMKNSSKNIPVAIFINKMDLAKRGLYVGKESIERWFDGINIKVDLFETTNTDMNTFTLPLRLFLNKIEGFPIELKDIIIKRVHEVF